MQIVVATLEFYIALLVLTIPLIAAWSIQNKGMLWLYAVAIPMSAFAVSAGLDILGIIH
jgi:hypothetical protein